MKGDFIKTKHMMDQIYQEVNIQVENSGKNLKNNRKPTNHKNMKYDKFYVKKMAKIHGHKSCKLYKNLLKSIDPILDTAELLKALTDQNDKIGDVKNKKLPDDLATTSCKSMNYDVNNKSETSASTSIQKLIKIPISRIKCSIRKKLLKIQNHTKEVEIIDLTNSDDEQICLYNEQYNYSLPSSSNVNVDVTDLPTSNDQSYSDNGQFNNALPLSSNVNVDVTVSPSLNEQSRSDNGQFNNILPSSSNVEDEVTNLTYNDNSQCSQYSQSRSDNGQFNNILPSSNVEDEVTNLTYNDNSPVCSSLTYCSIWKYYHENETNFSKLQNIISKHDISKSKTFKKLVSKLKKPLKYRLQNTTKLIYVWHHLNIRAINQLLKEILQTLNNTKNKIIHFIAFLIRLFHNSIDTAKLSNLEIYYEFFKFADFINKCLVSYDNKMAMKWLPYVWNNFFFYGCILIDNIIFNNSPMLIFVEWSKVPNIRKLFKILSYGNQWRSTNIINETDNNIEFNSQHPPNTTVP